MRKSICPPRPPRVAMIALGCPKNNVEAEHALSELISDGFALTTDPSAADLVLVNTCAFIQAARAETENVLATALNVRQKTRAKVVAIGCYAQRYRAAVKRKFPDLDGVIGIEAAGNFAARCREILSGKKLCCDFALPPREIERPRFLPSASAHRYLRLGDGCDNRCAYCAIPEIRGSLRSREMPAIIDEAKAFADSGGQELILVAQDTTAYGRDLLPPQNLVALVEKLLAAVALPRIRILYAHPAQLTRSLLQLIGREPRLCNYLDLPLQHVNTRILAAMGRHYDRQKIDQIFTWIAQDCPRLTLRSSFIVGFPSETSAEFAELLDFVKAGKICHLGAFVYSPETGTRAAEITPRVGAKTAKIREEKLMLAQQRIFFARQDQRIGGEEKVLVDTFTNDGSLIARGVSEAPEIDSAIIIRSQKAIEIGAWLNVKIIARRDYDLLAEILPTACVKSAVDLPKPRRSQRARQKPQRN